MASKIHEILTLIEGSHVMGNGLGDYYAAKKVRDALRIRSCNERFAKIKNALHAFRVTVSLMSSDPIQIRIRRNDLNKEITL